MTNERSLGVALFTIGAAVGTLLMTLPMPGPPLGAVINGAGVLVVGGLVGAGGWLAFRERLR